MARERLDLRLPSTYVDLPPIFLAAASRAAPLAHNPDVRPPRGRSGKTQPCASRRIERDKLTPWQGFAAAAQWRP